MTDAAETASARTPLAQGALDELVGYALRRAQLRLYEDLHATLARWQMTPARFSALAVIGANPGLKATTLADGLGIARSGAVVLLNGLQAMGYITRSAPDSDRRTLALDLTPEGRTALAEMTQAMQAHDQHATRRLDATERQTLLALLDRVG